ncbi:winged helix-turn-helix transcriptional regulator [Candidatus Woesearchaeota archaeon]|nr:winged helix-turn-helix transcriptional regulator [Candidatus Woesearchaeota archaeon]
MKENNAVISEVISNLGNVTEKFGMNSATGMIFGMLYFFGSKTQEQLKDELKLGLSTVSQSLTILEAFGFVKVEKDGRKKSYSANLEKSNAVLENIMRFNIQPLAALIESREKYVKDKETKLKLKLLREHCNSCCDKIERMMG